jgi:hypothetical protein
MHLLFPSYLPLHMVRMPPLYRVSDIFAEHNIPFILIARRMFLLVSYYSFIYRSSLRAEPKTTLFGGGFWL